MPLWKILCLFPPGIACICLLSGCTTLTISKPFAWPGLNTLQGRQSESAHSTVVLAITHAELIASRRGMFDAAADRVLELLPHQPGLVGYSVRTRLMGHEVWTATVWADESAMQKFVRSQPHRAAVKAGSAALKVVQYHRVVLPVSELPLDWSRVLAELANAPPAMPVDNAHVGQGNL